MENQEIQLHKITTDIKFPTEIEESLNSKAFYSALEKVINKSMYREETMWNLPYKVDFNRVKEAILEANSLLKGE